MRYKNFYFIFILFSTFFDANAQDVSIRSSVDSSKIMIGDAIKLNIKVTFDPQKYKVNLPLIPDTFNHFEIIEKEKSDTTQGKETNTITQQIRITNFDSGVWLIPTFEFKISPLNGSAPYILNSDSIHIYVNTIEVDTSKAFKPIYGIRSASMPLQQILIYIALGLLALILISLLIYYFWRKRKQKNESNQEPLIHLLPHEKALNHFEKLKENKLWQSPNQKQYYTELTDIVRTYLEEQFQIDCFEKTTSEIISQVKKVKALSTSRQTLRNLLEISDLVKFAKNAPSESERLESLENSKDMVLESYKKIKPIEIQ